MGFEIVSTNPIFGEKGLTLYYCCFFAGKTSLLCQAVNWWKHLNLGYWTLRLSTVELKKSYLSVNAIKLFLVVARAIVCAT